MTAIPTDVLARALRLHRDNKANTVSLDGTINVIAAIAHMCDNSFDHAQFKRDCGLPVRVDCDDFDECKHRNREINCNDCVYHQACADPRTVGVSTS